MHGDIRDLKKTANWARDGTFYFLLINNLGEIKYVI